MPNGITEHLKDGHTVESDVSGWYTREVSEDRYEQISGEFDPGNNEPTYTCLRCRISNLEDDRP